jgi:hypothetical protein
VLILQGLLKQGLTGPELCPQGFILGKSQLVDQVIQLRDMQGTTCYLCLSLGHTHTSLQSSSLPLKQISCRHFLTFQVQNRLSKCVSLAHLSSTLSLQNSLVIFNSQLPLSRTMVYSEF